MTAPAPVPQTPITLPDLHQGAEPVRVSAWLVDTGDTLEAGDRVVEVLMRSITFSVAAPVAGTLQRIEKPLDATLSAGDVLGWIAPAEPEGAETTGDRRS